MFKTCWEGSDSRADFAAALWEHGYVLAHGNRRNYVAVNADGKAFSLSRWCGVKTKALRARLGDPGDLPTVEDALALLPQNAEALDRAIKPNVDEAFKAALADLVSRQRTEREDVETQLEARRIAEVKARQARLPNGMRPAWAKLTGGYETLLGVQSRHLVDRI